MKRILVWDLSVRVLHWAMALSITGALVIGLAVDDDSPWFAYHMLCGLAAGGFVLIRLLLGLVGSGPARFTSWPWSLRELARYLRGVVTRRTDPYHGHNPGSVWMAVLVFVTVALLAVTGLVGGGERFEEPHEVLAYLLLGAVVAHLVGLTLHTLRRRENIAWSMIDGRKTTSEIGGLPRHGTWAGAVIAALVGLIVVGLFGGYDAATGRVHLPAIGLTLTLRSDSPEERPSERQRGGHERRQHRHDHD